MFIVESYCTLNSIVTYCIAMGKVFSKDSRAGFIFLGDIALVTFTMIRTRPRKLIKVSSAGNLNLGASKLCVIEKEGCLGSSKILSVRAI